MKKSRKILPKILIKTINRKKIIQKIVTRYENQKEIIILEEGKDFDIYIVLIHDIMREIKRRL